MLVIARGRDKGKLVCIRSPFNIGPFTAPALKVIAQGRAVLIGRQLQSNHARSVDLDYDSLDHGNYFVAGQRIFPGLQCRMAHLGFHQIHLADTPLVLLEGRDLFRVRRPKQHRTIAVNPTGIVRCVAKIFHAVRSELGLFACGHIAHPQIEVANKCCAFLVRRENVIGRAAAASTLSARRGRTLRAALLGY